MQQNEKKQFPRRFLWGASTAAHQVEGNTHNQWTVWELEHAKSLAAQAKYQLEDLEKWPEIEQRAKNPGNYVSGESVDHYNRYESDFDLLSELNMNAFRFSIEWSRVEPEEGAWNVESIDHYKAYVKALKKRNIEPVLTLFHFTLPVWFSEKGGFEKRKNTKYFVRFAEKILTELGNDVRLVITLNEPAGYALQSYHQGVWPPAQQNKITTLKVINNLAYTHNKTAKMIHGLSRRYKVSFADNTGYFYAGDDALLSRWTAGFLQYAQDDYFIKKVVKQCDFLAVNFYASNRVYGYRIHNPNERLNDLGWDMCPENLQLALERLNDKYKLPIIITENGLANEDDSDRKWWLSHTIIAMQKAMANGVKLQGYMHWSLLDNFEWAYGKWPKFGLVAVDYSTQKRTLRPSAVWFGAVIKKLRQEK